MELVWLTALAFLRSGDPVLILDPTFGEYRRAATLMGAQIHTCTASSHAAFCLDPEVILTTLQRLAPRVVFLCNPNNPTGTYLQIETIVAWAAAQPATLFVVDEAYLTFAAGASSMLQEQSDNVLVLRSMTKAYALAGVRLGYAVGHPAVLSLLHKVRPPWSVNALAQVAGIAALTDTAHIVSSLSHVAQAKQQLVRDLLGVGLEPVPSCTHFFLLQVGDATACRRVLLPRGILVRDCTSFGLPAYIRVATRRPEENARLLAALVETRSWYDSC
jgi:histidinol-phosphate aminotransferase